MLFPNVRLLVCPPKFYNISYEINPWMSIAHGAEHAVAVEQWQTLHHTLLRLGAWLEYVEPTPNQPDMVFTANAGLVYGKRVVLSSFRFKERKGEEEAFRKWFENAGYKVLYPSDSFEGEGDALMAGDLLVCGSGFRSMPSVFKEVKDFLGVTETLVCELVNPKFYHLDTCFCPVGGNKALYFPGAFSPDSLQKMQARLELYEVPEVEAQRFACNAVILGKDVVIPSGCKETEAILKSLGFNPHSVDMNEFIKAGGAAKCCVLKLGS